MNLSFKADKSFKKLVKELAEKEHRSLSSFIINAVATYMKEHHGIDWQKAPKKSSKQ